MGTYAVTARVAFMPEVAAKASCELVARDASGFHDADNVTLFSGSVNSPVPGVRPSDSPITPAVPNTYYFLLVRQAQVGGRRSASARPRRSR